MSYVKKEKTEKKKSLKKRIRKIFRKATSREVIIKIVVIFSGLALVAGYVLPYIVRQ
jgi:hypothetical protein